ncbi:hypothetical protein EDB85DRAFT_2000008 [Lactarius pseudohatsudake]|nr:hypothetical protein EDB85DRAFT_2000008 [Lactarius pseudohatsudake]
MPIPELHSNTHISPGLNPGYALQPPSITHSQSHPGMLEGHHIPVNLHRNQYDSYRGGDRDDYDNSATHSSGAIPKGPPDRPVAGIQGTPNGSSNSHFNWARNMVRGNRPQNQTMTPAPSVAAPQPATFRCRLLGCRETITGDVATRLNGFCCNSHRDMSGVTTPHQHSRR